MGKAKKTRSTSHKKQVPPTGGLTMMEMEEINSEDYSSMMADEAEMFKGLVALEGSIREATCVTLATMYGEVGDEQNEQRLQKKLQKMIDAGLLKKLIPRMVDPLKMVRLHALGALRNISVTGGIEICELMTTQNVITPLVKIITENATAATFEKNDLHAVQVLEQSIALLSNLCESCQAAINELTGGNLLAPIMLIAEKSRSHTVLLLETLKLLLLITESNQRLNEVFGANAAYQKIIGDTVESEQVSQQIKLTAVGIAMNIKAIMQAEANVVRLLPVIERALAYDAVNVTQLAQHVADHWELSQRSTLDEENVDGELMTEEERQAIESAQLKLRNWKDNVHTLALALELVADLAAPGDENDDEEEWGSDDEDAMEEYAQSHMETSGEGSASGIAAHKALSASSIFQLSVTILQGLVTIPQLSARTVVSDFEKMRIRVCNAVNNLLQVVSSDVLGETALSTIFRNLCTLYSNVKVESSAQPFEFVGTSTNNIEAATTSAMWSSMRRASAEHQDLPISGDEANLIMTRALQSPSMETRMNTIGLIGCVGKRTKNATENEVIGRCLLSSLNDSSLEVVAEALNAVFDVYGDEDFDSVFRSLQFLGALERTATAVKAKLRSEHKQMDRDLVAHVKETHLNLVRFIKYKKKHFISAAAGRIVELRERAAVAQRHESLGCAACGVAHGLVLPVRDAAEHGAVDVPADAGGREHVADAAGQHVLGCLRGGGRGGDDGSGRERRVADAHDQARQRGQDWRHGQEQQPSDPKRLHGIYNECGGSWLDRNVRRDP